MSIDFRQGSIIKFAPFAERIKYATGNNRATAEFDGTGAISKYAVMNKYSVFSSFFALFSIDGKAYDWSGEKEVKMIGRMQTTKFSIADVQLESKQFLDENDNAIYVEFLVESDSDFKFEATMNFGIDFLSYLEHLPAGRLNMRNFMRLIGGVLKKKKRKHEKIETVDCIRGDVTGDFYLDVASNVDICPLESERGFYNQFSIGGDVPRGTRRVFRYVLSAGTRGDFTFVDVAKLLPQFEQKLQKAEEYIEFLVSSTPKKCNDDEKLKSFYVSLLNCALCNYKELGEFKGFLAGLVYQFPARTYFRDGYWTTLAVLPVKPELVRNEILTLSRGVNKNTGDCASAVKFNFKSHWGQHYDSPSFLSLMTYDYIAASRDYSILDERVGGITVLDLVEKVINRLREKTDKTGLLVKDGKYNRRDWCDNVFRTGYVTYDCVLYARALYALSEFFRVKGLKDKSAHYANLYEKVKSAINEILWDDDKGWFVNYKSDDFIEGNLSIDTIIVALFEICDKQRAKRMLVNAERLLESKNNNNQCAGDFGTLCVFPFYSDARATVQKSSLPYFYHNGADWPYWSCIYAYAKYIYGMNGDYPLTRWFESALERGTYTPTEFYSPFHPEGSLLQAWSATGAFTLAYYEENFFARKL
ncbi:MAG: hypothetical protein LBE09_02395 [Christensenellaceae bacterium]|jgi:glycogen debranching enzyme|nr:hypothetical protein [Christensenellaceae bacterium]